jgi:hypothetical protein
MFLDSERLKNHFPQQCLDFLPLPHPQASFLQIFGPVRCAAGPIRCLGRLRWLGVSIIISGKSAYWLKNWNAATLSWVV